MKDSAIIGFWDWFRQESEALKTIATGKEEIAKSLSSQLNSIGILNWEIGHQRDSLVYFALSAEIDEDRLIFNQYAASLCDPIPVGWTILSSIPPKQWDGVMIWDGLNVNTNDWEFRVYRYPDGKHDIVFFSNYGLSDFLNIATTSILSEIGEEWFIKFVCDISVDKNQDRAGAVQGLHNIIKLLDINSRLR